MSKANKPIEADTDGMLAVTRRNINIYSYGVIRGIMGGRIVEGMPLRLRCECPFPSCEKIIEVLLAKRREIRRQFPTGFIVAAAHTDSSTKTLYQAADYAVVEMEGYSQAVVDL